ncbi:hypothetical protein Dimus_032048, partial [Dionaea muscipula]
GVAAAVLCYKKETDQWIAASRAINTAVKNWMKVMEYDCRSINAAIRDTRRP